MTTLQQDAEVVHALTDEAVREWWRKATASPGVAVHLYFRPSAGAEAGELRALWDEEVVPEGFRLAAPDRISPAWDREKARTWIHGVARRLLILPTE